MLHRMVAWQEEKNWKYRKMADTVMCSIGMVYNVLQLYEQYGQVTNPLAH